MNGGRAELQPRRPWRAPGMLQRAQVDFGKHLPLVFPCPCTFLGRKGFFQVYKLFFSTRGTVFYCAGSCCSDCRAPAQICCAVGITRLSTVEKSSSKNKFPKGFLGVEPPEAPQDSRFLELLQGLPWCLGWQLGQGLGAQMLGKFFLSLFRAN